MKLHEPPFLLGFLEPHSWVFWSVWALLVGVPTSALSLSWIQFFRKFRVRARPALLGATFALTILSLSDAIFLCALDGIWLWGRNQRFIVMEVNFCAALVMLILALALWSKKNPSAEWIVISAAAMALVWFYVGVISSAV